MWTSCAHYRRTDRDILVESHEFLLLAEKLLCDDRLRKLTDISEYFLALYIVYTDIAAVLLDNAVKLLDNVYLLILLCEVLYKLYRERIYHTQLQHGSLVAESLFDILICSTVCDNAEFSLVRYLNPVER